jgi:hypothetical protein
MLTDGPSSILSQAGFEKSHVPRKDDRANRLAAAFAVNTSEIEGFKGSIGSIPERPTEGQKFQRSAAGINGLTVPGRKGLVGLDCAATRPVALWELPALLARWLPRGRIDGREYKARKPCRDYPHRRSHHVTIRTSRRFDFATGDTRRSSIHHVGVDRFSRGLPFRGGLPCPFRILNQ